VTGFLTADPRVVPDARPLSRLSYAEAAELAFFGAKVLHPKTIQPAVETRIPVRICNSRHPELPGTLINGESHASAGGVKAIAHKPGVTLLQISSTRMLGAYGFLRALFEVFDRHRTGVDVVSTSEVSVSLSIDDTRRLPAILHDLEPLGSTRVVRGNAIVCVVGEGIGDLPGVAARVFGTISDINVVLISQGASSINLTFVVSELEVNDAVNRLHATFFPKAG
jgi:aspartate kinase